MHITGRNTSLYRGKVHPRTLERPRFYKFAIHLPKREQTFQHLLPPPAGTWKLPSSTSHLHTAPFRQSLDPCCPLLNISVISNGAIKLMFKSSIGEFLVNSKLALVTPGGATSAVFWDLQKDICFKFPPTLCLLISQNFTGQLFEISRWGVEAAADMFSSLENSSNQPTGSSWGNEM